MTDSKSTLFACLLVLAAGAALAMPGGAQIAAGSAAFAQNGNRLTVTNSPGAILNWQNFSIGAAESVRFVQQSAQSAVLNRVVGQNPSSILGSLQSNGRVFLINPNGITFGADARIDVAGLVASSLNIGDADFLAGRHHYTGAAAAGGVANQGSIATPDGGLVYLIAPDVRNSGVINAPGGDVLLAAGHSVSVAPAVSPDVRVQITAPAGGQAMNVGRLIAQSGSIGLYGANVTQAGVADATTAVAGANGRIYLKASDRLTAATGSTTSADGGDIVATSGARTTVEAGATVRADAGRIKIWSDGETHANGSFRAHEGFIETSGRIIDTAGAAIDAKGGTWLIDPSNISIENHNVLGSPLASCATVGSTQTCDYSGASVTSHLDADLINTALNNGTDVVVDTAAGSAGSGYITLYGNLVIAKTGGARATLTLNADNTISANGGTASISASNGAILDMSVTANRTTASGTGGITGLGNVSTNGGNFTATASNIQLNGSSISTAGGNITLTANNAAGTTGLYQAGTLSSAGGRISLTSNATTGSAINLTGTTDAGSGYITLSLPNGGTATDNSTGSHTIASGLELLGNNATYQLGSYSNFNSGGRAIYAPGASTYNTAQATNSKLTVAGNLTGTSSVYLSVGASTPTYQAGYGMNTDLEVGSVGTSTGLSATTVSLSTANGNISQTQKITATDLYASAYNVVQGSKVDLTFAAGNSVTNLNSGGALCSSGGGCTVAAAATPSYRFTNATTLKITGTIDAGNGAAVIKTLTGNLNVPLSPSGVIYSKLAGTSSNYANAVILVAGANTPAHFINNSGSYVFNLNGAYSRYVIYSKDATNINMGGSPPYSATASGGYTPYFGAAYYASPFDGSGLPAVPANAAKQHALVFQTQPTLNITAQAASRQYGNANPTFSYTSSGFVLGDTAGTALSGGLGTAATVTSGVGTYPITQGTLAANGYLVNYTGANLTVSQRPVTIAANPQTKTYGGADPALTYTVSAGSVANSDVLNLTRTAGENVGSYPISLGSNPNYSVTYTGNNLDITPAVVVVIPTVTAISAAVVGNPSKTYDGTTTAFLSSGNFALSGFVGGDSATVTKTTGSYDSAAVGTRTVTVSLGSGDFAAGPGTSFSNYSLPTSATGTGTIVAAPLTVTAAGATRTYDGRAYSGGNGVNYAGFVNGETAAVLGGTLSYGGSAQGAVNAGSYAISASGLSARNYAISYVDGKLEIGRAALTVAANDAAKIYDGSAYRGGNGVRITGFVNGESQAALGGTLAYGGSAQGAINGGNYAISPSGLTSGNYAIRFVDGRLVVNTATLTVTANDASKTYDGVGYRGGNGVRYAGFVNGEGPSALGGALAYGGSSQGAVEVGSYAISPSGLSSANYAIGYVDGTLTVERMPARVVNTLVGDSVSATTAAAGMATTAVAASSGSSTSGNSAAGESESPKSPAKGRSTATAKEKGSSKDAPPAKPRC